MRHLALLVPALLALASTTGQALQDGELDQEEVDQLLDQVGDLVADLVDGPQAHLVQGAFSAARSAVQALWDGQVSEAEVSDLLHRLLEHLAQVGDAGLVQDQDQDQAQAPPRVALPPRPPRRGVRGRRR